MGQSAIYRFSGTLQDGDEAVPWALILKVIPHTLHSDDAGVGKRTQRQREVEFYGSALVHQLPTGFRAARCFAVSEQAGDEGQPESWLWLEALEPHPGSQWTLDDHYHLARGLGLLNGTFLVNPPQPAPWLASDGIRSYLEHAEPLVNQWLANLQHPLVQRAFPASAITSFVELWQSRAYHLQTLARLPQTLCHGDAQVSNLFLDKSKAEQPETVAIDWAGVGVGPLGFDPAQLLSFSLATNKVDIAQASALDQAIFEGYLVGLQAAGWHGAPKVVRLGYTAATLKTRTMGVIRAVPFLLDETTRRDVEAKLKTQGLAFENMLDITAQYALFLERLFHESVEFRDQLYEGQRLPSAS
jgi:hypothetical protein